MMQSGSLRKILQKAQKTANLSLGVGRNKNYRVGAVLFDKRENILACKFNSYKTHPILSKFTKYPHLHAEQACLLHRGLDNCEGLSILVTRVKHPNNTLTMASPCDVCMNMLKLAGIKNIYYTGWSGELLCK